MTKNLDIVLFGATGITGQHTIPILAKLCNTKNLTWGVAGRSERKLKDVLEEMQTHSEFSLHNVPIIIADVNDDKSLHEMARQARIIINCCGPFRFFGEQVVKACIDEGTHHVDVTAEIQFMEKMQLKYHEKAEEKGIYVISSCAYASIPVDVAITHMQKKFSGVINSVVAYYEIWEEDENVKGTMVNYGTYESLAYVFLFAKEVKEIRKQLFPMRLPVFKPKLKPKIISHKSDVVSGWTTIFPTPDRAVVRRSQRKFYENEFQRPVQIETQLCVKKFIYVILLALSGLFILILRMFPLGRKIVINYPQVFSGGLISRNSPNIKRTENTNFSVTLYAEGWKEKMSHPDEEYTVPPNKAMVAKISGKNPAYGATCVCAALAAVVLLTEEEKVPSKGGVLPPGYAFAKTSMFDQLNQHGIEFQMLYEKNM